MLQATVNKYHNAYAGLSRSTWLLSVIMLINRSGTVVVPFMTMPFMNSYWISRTQHANRGQYAALYTMAWSAAQTLGPMFGARMADKYGFNVL